MADNHPMSDLAVRALAAFIADQRADWQNPGIVAELRRQRDHYDPWQLAAAMCKRASDPKNTTPRLQPFDREGFVACRRHPTSTTRTDGTCSVCRNDALAVEYVPRPGGDVRHPLRAAVARLHPEAAS